MGRCVVGVREVPETVASSATMAMTMAMGMLIMHMVSPLMILVMLEMRGARRGGHVSLRDGRWALVRCALEVLRWEMWVVRSAWSWLDGTVGWRRGRSGHCG